MKTNEYFNDYYAQQSERERKIVNNKSVEWFVDEIVWKVFVPLFFFLKEIVSISQCDPTAACKQTNQQTQAVAVWAAAIAAALDWVATVATNNNNQKNSNKNM